MEGVGVNMRKALIVMLSALMLALLCACGGASEQASKASLNVGDTASTDIFDLTLDDATFAIALESSIGEVGYGSEIRFRGNDAYGEGGAADIPFFLPKEYDAEDDSDNPYVAPKGHSLVAFTVTVKNNDRVSQELYEGLEFAKIGYNGSEYTPVELEWGVSVAADGSWMAPLQRVSYAFLGAGETISYRMYADIEVEPEDLADSFEMTFAVPNSKGGTDSFTYIVGQ